MLWPRLHPNRAVAISCLLASCLLASGCLSNVPLNPTAEGLSFPARLPLSIGWYSSAAFQAYEIEDRYQGFVMPIGRASATLFQEITAMLFEQSPPVLARPSLTGPAAAVRAVIEPTIVMVDLGSGMLQSSELFWAEIAYRFILSSPQGDVIASWTVTGVGITEANGSLSRHGYQGQAVDMAIRNAGARLLDVFQGVPEVRQWLGGVGVEVVRDQPVRFGHTP